jgi:hypothetical protein
VADPDPAVDFGCARQEYSYGAWRLARKLLVVGITCNHAHRVMEIVYEELFPKRVGLMRIPDRRQWETWRKMLSLEARARLLKFLNRVDHWHVISDASTKGSSRKSRKTNVLQSAAKGVQGEKNWDVMLHFDVIRSGSAQEEADSMERECKLQIGDEVIAEAPLLNCVSGATDHASGASKSMKLFGEKVLKKFDDLAPEQLAGMSESDIAKAKVFYERHCQEHLDNVLGQNYIGSRVTPKKLDGHPDKIMVTHGKTEYAVQSRLCAIDILSRHFDIWGGRRKKDESSDESLYRWAWQRMQPRWHKCKHNKNPTPWTAESIPSVSGGMHTAQKLLSDKGEATTHHLNVSLLLGQWMKDNGHVSLAMFLAWKGMCSFLSSSFLP